MDKPKILVIDDEQTVRQLLKQTLEAKKYDVETAEDGKIAIEKIKSNFFNLLITDLRMPKVGGVDVVKEVKKVNPYTEAIVLTGYPSISTAVEAIKTGASDYLCKPFDMSEMLATVDRCLDNQKVNVNYVELSELMTLLEVSKAIATAPDFDSILEQILDSALKLVKARRGSIMLLDEKTEELTIKVARGLSDEVVKNTRIKLDQSICGKVLKNGKPLMVVDIEQDRRVRRKSRSEYKTKSFISLRLMIKHLEKNALGVINITDKVSGESFNKREQILLSLLAGQAGAVVENYRLYSQLQNKITDLKNTIRELNETQNQLIQIEKMAAVGRLLFDIAHEIRNPLAIILGGVEFLRNNMTYKDDLISGSMDRIINSVNRANNIIIDFLKFSRVSKLDLDMINICELMDEVLSMIKDQAKLKNVTITREYFSELIGVMADPAMLRQVFFNLCSNAMDAMSAGGRLTLRIYPDQAGKDQDKRVAIEIEDTGSGIPRDILSKVFDPFFTTKEPGKGTGLGLSIVRTILDRHKGIIDVKSEAGKGTTFIMKLPAAKATAQSKEKMTCQTGKEYS
ncbi:MAG TPA: response regulator [Nitrospirae bacterium]|nr:sporulation kinase A [bacterium BMS3Abin10]GBE39595.1 sporulation kinase A [bacterium BMS3Bbin08]HDH00775.1 response regulator [Nitrospirota bacterium]HDK82152.1 response regulator [Nitrospirota bacterium]HDO26454.1 response regulator [Nitrospirota bacterium]